MLKLTCLFIFIAVLQYARASSSRAYVKALSGKQAERLASWTENEKQNIWELSGQTEGDMVLVPGQRNGLIDARFRWTNNIIPYEISPDFSEEQRNWIINSLEAYEQNSCVITRQRAESDVDYIYVTGESTGCWSFVGRRGGRQQLNLQPNSPGNGCLRAGTIVHEFLHAAGFYHQHSATERDDYVTIVWENIQQGTEHNFDKYDDTIITSFGQAYDYGSIMHYGAFAFSINDEKTIVPKDPTAEIGQRERMSDIDIAKLNQMYNC